jgi:hypothetical protein
MKRWSKTLVWYSPQASMPPGDDDDEKKNNNDDDDDGLQAIDAPDRPHQPCNLVVGSSDVG